MPELSRENEGEIEETSKKLPRQQKIAVVFLALIAIGVVTIWALQFNSWVYKPFKAPKNNNQAESLIDSNLIDSDGDTLTDYEEINTYKTSPYLEDTDSDAINDNEEIAKSSNPNCPTGQTCNILESEVVPNNPVTTTEIGETPNPSLNEKISDPSQVTPDILRQVLLESGYDKETLDKISDEDILKSYQEALKADTNQ